LRAGCAALDTALAFAPASLPPALTRRFIKRLLPALRIIIVSVTIWSLAYCAAQPWSPHRLGCRASLREAYLHCLFRSNGLRDGPATHFEHAAKHSSRLPHKAHIDSLDELATGY